MRTHLINGTEWVYHSTFHYPLKHYLYCKTSNKIYEFIDGIVLPVEDNSIFLKLKEYSWAELNKNIIDIVITRHMSGGYIIVTDRWKYTVEITMSPNYSTWISSRERNKHPLSGYNFKHVLKIEDTKIVFPYFKTRLMPKEMIEKFVENYCIMPDDLGFKCVCNGMFKKLDSIRAKWGNSKEKLRSGVAMEKLLK